jgi:hypothetical protein
MIVNPVRVVRSKNMKHEYKLARKVLWSSITFSLVAAVAVFFEISSFSFAVECIILTIGILVTCACLLFLIKEYRSHQATERALIQQVVALIDQQALSSVKPALLTKALEAHLAHLDPEQRINVLNQSLNNPSQLLKLLSEESLLRKS